MVELRKVQRTLGGTFFVCLPKSWAERYGLERGSVVSLAETGEGKLVVDSRYGVEPSPRSVSLKPGPYLGREIVGNYLLGFDVMRVEAKDRIGFDVRETVKNSVGRLIGLEIIEEDYSNIVLQCLLEPSGFPPEKILRRGHAIVAGMHRDAVNAFVDGDVQLAKSVVARDDESNRLYFLLVRILRTIVQNPGLSEKLGVSPIECLDYRLAASLVEAIGDECVRIAVKAVESGGAKLEGKLGSLLMNFQALCFDAHKKALAAFFAGDVDLAERVKTMRDKIEKEFKNIEITTRARLPEAMPQILAAASFLRQIYEHSVDVSDLAVPRKS
jgi:phosphate uptake regulator